MGGMSGAGGEAGMGGAAGEAGMGGAAGEATAAMGGAGGAGGSGPKAPPVTGSVVFSRTTNGVTVGIALAMCADGKTYPIHIHAGTTCESMESTMGHWDPPRGENIPDITCMGSTANVSYTRTSDDAKPWTIGPPMESNIVGHVVVLHDPDDPSQKIACGPILMQ